MTNTCKIVIRDGVPFRETPRGELYSVTLLDCGDEIERLNKKCAALALLLYGPKPNAVEPRALPAGFFRCGFCHAEAPEGKHVCGDEYSRAAAKSNPAQIGAGIPPDGAPSMPNLCDHRRGIDADDKCVMCGEPI